MARILLRTALVFFCIISLQNFYGQGSNPDLQKPESVRTLAVDTSQQAQIEYQIYYRHNTEESWDIMPEQSWLGSYWKIELKSNKNLLRGNCEFKGGISTYSKYVYFEFQVANGQLIVEGDVKKIKELRKFTLLFNLKSDDENFDKIVIGDWLFINDYGPVISDVTDEFFKINVHGDYMAAWAGDYIPEPWYTTSIKNMMGFRNHFQGIQRLTNTNYLAISGSNTNERMSNIFIVKIDSRRENGDWTSNKIFENLPPPQDRIVRKLDVDSILWHAGGLGMLGEILAVPIYGGNPLRGKIIFYLMGDPANPQKLEMEVQRPDRKAYAVTLLKLKNGYYLLAVLSDRDDKPRRVDFYLSKSQNFLDGFDPEFVSWFTNDIIAKAGEEANFTDFQSISFIQQSDGQLFLVGFHNTALNLRIIPGRDYADLYSVTFPANFNISSDPELTKPVIQKITNQQFFCKDGQCNMDAAAGLYIHPNGELSLYAATFWLEGNMIKFMSFALGRDSTSLPIEDLDDCLIELYEDENFSGHILSLYGENELNLSDYADVHAQEIPFNDKVSSIRYQIPEGYIYRLYEMSDFSGKSIDLVGTGKFENMDDLQKLDFDNRISSSQIILE